MKIFALYLPQFHEIKENNEWWGEGFTEWINVKKALPLYKGHIQPRHPKNGNYYDLMDKSTVEWQTSLMNNYNVDGFIYYHYYFEGKLLLEKPAENLLKWKEVKQKFFFNWANHSWNRSWKGSKELLLKQTYGNEESWKKHFEYLLPFFKDDRYEKIENKPVFMIYDTNFTEMVPMFNKFNEWCLKEGFNGIYIIEEHMNLDLKKYESAHYDINYYITQPYVGKKMYLNDSIIRKYCYKIRNRLVQKGLLKCVEKYDANKLIRMYMKKMPRNCNLINGIYFEWDNTPRHGYRGSVIEPISKETFFEYMNSISKNDYVVVNAWNEWAEGMILEPTEENGFQYLEWIKEWKETQIIQSAVGESKP